MVNELDKLVMYEVYQKQIEILDDDDKFNEFMNGLDYMIENRENTKNKENKSIILYKKNNYNDIYITYIMFSAVIYQLIIGEEKTNTYFSSVL